MALKHNKEKDFSEWYTELVSEAGANLADMRYGIQGAIVETPWAVKILRAFEAMLEKEVEADGHEPMLLPTIVPEAYIKLGKGESITVYSGKGTDSENTRYWNLKTTVWNNDGDTVFLRDAEGNVAAIYAY